MSRQEFGEAMMKTLVLAVCAGMLVLMGVVLYHLGPAWVLGYGALLVYIAVAAWLQR